MRRQTELENGWHAAGSLQDVGFVVCNQIPCFIWFVMGNGGEYFFFLRNDWFHLECLFSEILQDTHGKGLPL